MKKLLLILVLAISAWVGYGKYNKPRVDPSIVQATSPVAAAETTGSLAAATFQCDGRTMCSQMHSCDEASFFIQHCPSTKMDGDGDGVPCESQWCN
jgi:hypothetical protein